MSLCNLPKNSIKTDLKEEKVERGVKNDKEIHEMTEVVLSEETCVGNRKQKYLHLNLNTI